MHVERQKHDSTKRLASHWFKVAHREYMKAKTTGCVQHYQKAVVAYTKANRIASGGLKQS